MTRLVISGSRGIESEKAYEKLCDMVRVIQETMGPITEIVHGACPSGVDVLAEMYLQNHHITPARFPAKWKRPDGSRDRGAGHKRNRVMAHYADVGIMIWDSKSPGTRNMISEMSELEKPYYVAYWKES